MENKEALIDIYLEKLKEPNTDKSIILQQFYNILYSGNYNGKLLIAIRKLIKLYGVKRVFNAILSTYDMEKFNPESPYGLLSYFCKKQIESDTVVVEYIDISKVEKKRHKVKFEGDPFDD